VYPYEGVEERMASDGRSAMFLEPVLRLSRFALLTLLMPYAREKWFRFTYRNEELPLSSVV
jgi:hypothetical protein